MAKIFREIFTPEEFEIYNLKGEAFKVQSLFMDSEATNKIEHLIKDKELTNTEIIHQILILRIGKDEAFWKQFSLTLLGEISKHFTEEVKKSRKYLAR